MINQYSLLAVAPNVRFDSWLWLYRRRNLNIIPCDFNLQLGSTLASTMVYTEYFQLKEIESANHLLPNSALSWITRDRRQLKWALSYIEFRLRCDIPDCPPLLEGRDRVIASLDFWSRPLSDKSTAVEIMKLAWYQVLREDEEFGWLKDQTAACLEFVWKWLVKKGRAKDFKGAPILSHKDILNFYDEIGADASRKRVDATDIKNAWATKNHAKKKREEGMSPCNVWISNQAIENLAKLSVKLKLNRAQVVELIINKEFENNNLSPKKY